MIYSDLVLIQRVHMDKCSKSLITGIGNKSQGLLDNYPVLIPELHHITNRGDSGKDKHLCEKVLIILRILTELPCQNLKELVGHNGSAYFLKGIAAL